jgi:ribose 5-phosphate isomerase
MKNINRGVKKIQDKKGAEFVLDDNGNFVLDPDYKPTPWKQDPDLNESIKKEINKIRKLL